MYFLKLKHYVVYSIQKSPQMTFYLPKQFLSAFTSHRCTSCVLSKASESLMYAINCKVFRDPWDFCLRHQCHQQCHHKQPGKASESPIFKPNPEDYDSGKRGIRILITSLHLAPFTSHSIFEQSVIQCLWSLLMIPE